MGSKWKTYQEVATYLLNQFCNEFGLEYVTGEYRVIGKLSKTRWNLDATGFHHDGEGFLIVECRRYTKSKQNQEKVAGLAYRILDTGADGGILVSPLGLQTGAEKVAKAANIISVKLDENSTPYEFGMQFLSKIICGLTEKPVFSDCALLDIVRICKLCGQQFNTDDDESYCIICKRKTYEGILCQ